MNEFEYFVDNNVLSKLTREQRSNEFFRSHCHLPTEVIYEARALRDIDQLRLQEYETTAAVLRQLAAVLSTVPADDTSLLDLYTNTGNADPLLVACALDARSDNDGKLFGPTQVVVSNDKAVQALAAKFDLTVLDEDQFKTLIDGSTGDR